MLRLRTPTPSAWVALVVTHLDAFLQDHASNERKISGSALTLATQYPARRPLVDAMVELAREELEHFARVYALLVARGCTLGQDAPDPYMSALRHLVRRQPDIDDFLVGRLVLFAVVEARACERFGLLADALPDPTLRDFYAELARAEARHHGLFLRLAQTYKPAATVNARLDAVLDAEAEIVATLPIRPALH